jgi:hypothetical protein
MKWRAHKQEDGSIDPSVAVSDTHTIVKVFADLFISYRRGNTKFGKIGHIIGRWSTPALARKCCEEDFPGKEHPPDTRDTYPEGRPTLDAEVPQSGTGSPEAGGRDVG